MGGADAAFHEHAACADRFGILCVERPLLRERRCSAGEKKKGESKCAHDASILTGLAPHTKLPIVFARDLEAERVVLKECLHPPDVQAVLYDNSHLRSHPLLLKAIRLCGSIQPQRIDDPLHFREVDVSAEAKILRPSKAKREGHRPILP